jgi:hypothetical protein
MRGPPNKEKPHRPGDRRGAIYDETGRASDNGLLTNLSAKIGQEPNPELAAAAVIGAPGPTLPTGEPGETGNVMTAGDLLKRVYGHPGASKSRGLRRKRPKSRFVRNQPAELAPAAGSTEEGSQ